MSNAGKTLYWQVLGSQGCSFDCRIFRPLTVSSLLAHYHVVHMLFTNASKHSLDSLYVCLLKNLSFALLSHSLWPFLIVTGHECSFTWYPVCTADDLCNLCKKPVVRLSLWTTSGFVYHQLWFCIVETQYKTYCEHLLVLLYICYLQWFDMKNQNFFGLNVL